MSERQEKAGDVFFEVLEADALAQDEKRNEENPFTVGMGTFLTLFCC
jgi:hypothetical protein